MTLPPLDPIATNEPTSLEAGPAPEFELVRIRIVLVVGATFVIALFTGGALVALGVPGVGPLVGLLLAAAPRPAILGLAVAFPLAIVVVAWMTLQVIQPAERLAASRNNLGVLYASARSHALEDSLTGLANHRAFLEEFEHLLAFSARHETDLALLLIDVDDFKTVNDSAGHAVGDDLLVEMGHILRRLRASDRAFRIGGDEFAILMPRTNATDARTVAEHLLARCIEPRPDGTFPRAFAFSGGITSAPSCGWDRDLLYNRADEALYQAKRDGRCRIQLFDPANSRTSTPEPARGEGGRHRSAEPATGRRIVREPGRPSGPASWASSRG